MISKKKLWILVATIILFVNVFVFLFGNEKNTNYQLKYDIESDKVLLLELYYSEQDDIVPENVFLFQMTQFEQEVKFDIPSVSKLVRIDLGKEAAEISVKELQIEANKKSVVLSGKLLEESIVAVNHIESIQEYNDTIHIVTNGEDPYVLIDIGNGVIGERIEKSYEQKLIREKAFICVVFDIILILIAMFAVRLFIIVSDVYYNRRLVFNLAKNDFRTKYAGSFFGMIWAFVQPIVTIVLYWFVFQVGLGSGDVDGKPFVLWLVAGLVPWMFFQDALMYGTNALLEYSYLVKKVVFNISVLPIVKIISACIVHGFFLLITVALYTLMGYFPGIQLVQVLYYSLCTAALAIGLSYACSAIVLFFRDLSQIINIILQVGTWMTPIMWQIERIPQEFRWIFKLNPMYYVVQGYRDALLDNVWFFERLSDTAYFWFIVVGLYAVGALVFQKLKPHFADVL